MFARSAPRAALALVLTFAAGHRAAGQAIDCEKGDREVVSLKFQGNQAFSSDELALHVGTTPSQWIRRVTRYFGQAYCLDPVQLRLDVGFLRGFYREEGFYEARVDTTVSRSGSERVAVTFRIDEGRPMIVDSVRVAGLDNVPVRNEVVRDLKLVPGGRFGLVRLFTDVDSIRSRLRNAGYAYAVVFRNYGTDSVAHTAWVRLNVAPGPRTRFDGVRLEVTPRPDTK